MKKYIIYTFISVFMFSVLNSCSDDTEYDIDWPVPVIENVSSYNSFLSSTLTLTGNFTQVNKVFFGNVEGDNLNVSSDEKSLTIDVPRAIDIYGAPIIVKNNYNQSYQTSEKFVPIIPETLVTNVSEIQVGLTFTVEGNNVDLVSEILVNGEEASIISSGINTIIVSVAGLDLRPEC
jgi:hypothetical protein